MLFSEGSKLPLSVVRLAQRSHVVASEPPPPPSEPPQCGPAAPCEQCLTFGPTWKLPVLSALLVVLLVVLAGCGGDEHEGCKSGESIQCGPVLGGDWECNCEPEEK